MNKAKILLIIILLFSLCNEIEAQVRIVNSASASAAANSSAFIDASSNNTANTSTNIGKGLLFPRTNLTTLALLSGAPTGLPVSYPTRFDGMIVYNNASGTAAIGGGEVKPGFYYYENKSTTVNGGKWVRLADDNDSSSIGYYGVLATNNPGSADILGLSASAISSGSYNGKFDHTLSVAGYFTVALPVSWRAPLLTINGNETFNVFLPVKTIDINGLIYQVWQSDVSLISGLAVAVN